MPDEQLNWKNVEEKLIPLVRSSIILMDKMLQSISLNYINRDKLYPYRELCFGFMLTARNNSEATLKLIEANLVDQIHLISRNTFEMMVILYYIDNDDDKSKRDQLTERYFDYSDVIAYRSLNIMKKYPELFAGVRTNENDIKIDKSYQDFLYKYTKGIEKRGLLNKWSGMDLPGMIECLKDEKKNDLMKRYKLMISSNNNFIHPTALLYRQSIIKHLEGKVDYQFRVKQIHSVVTSADLIIAKCLEQFPKGRPAFKIEYNDINNRHNELVNNARSAGLIEAE